MINESSAYVLGVILATIIMIMVGMIAAAIKDFIERKKRR